MQKHVGCNKTMLNGKSIAVTAYIKREEITQISNLTYDLRTLE